MTAFISKPKIAELWFGCLVAIHSMNAYVWCWRKACGSLDEIQSVTMGTCKRKFLMNSNMTLTVFNLHQQTDPKVQQDFKGQYSKVNQCYTMTWHT